jgi:hypothetical protein
MTDQPEATGTDDEPDASEGPGEAYSQPDLDEAPTRTAGITETAAA